MNVSVLSPEKDPMGLAIADFHQSGRANLLRVFSSQFDEDEMPVSQLFRTESQMPAIERKALEMACGSILDVGVYAFNFASFFLGTNPTEIISTISETTFILDIPK